MKSVSRIVLPGQSAFNRFIAYGAALTFSVIMGSIAFMGSLDGKVNELYVYRGNERVLVESRNVCDINELLAQSNRWFTIIIIACIINIILNYIRVYRNNNQYVFMRMDNPGLMHRMCLTVPLIIIAAAIILAGIMIYVYYLGYINEVPAQCMPQWNGINIWRTF